MHFRPSDSTDGWRYVRCTSLVYCVATIVCYGLVMTRAAHAAPTLKVSNLGPNVGGNLEWLVEVAPDAGLFTNTDLGLGGSVAVELSFEVIGSELLAVSVNNTDWPVSTPGENPFTRTVTSGVQTDLVSDTVFASLLSNFFVSGNDVEVLTIETSGTDCTTLSWGGQTVLGGTPEQYESSLIAQGGQTFTGYAGSLIEPAHDGDFDIDCDVDGDDLLHWQQGYGAPYGASDLTDWQSNYGSMAPVSAVVAAVPEPSSLLLALIALQVFACRKHSSDRI